MSKNHTYKTTVSWKGTPKGTLSYTSYSRNHIITTKNKPPIAASSDALFRGDSKRYSPEELLVASASSCHMLWYLHLCSVEGVVVLDYTDEAIGTMIEEPGGSGRLVEIILNPTIMVVNTTMKIKADKLHHKANQLCFIANFLNFPIRHHPTILIAKNKK